jgi:hypothetical protein
MNRTLGRVLTLLPCMFACGAPPPPGTGGAGGTGGGGSNLPCDVATVLQNKCQRCHSTIPQFGAPISLMTYADTQAPRNGQQVWQVMQSAIAAGRMPQNDTLSTQERSTLDNWFAQNAPGSGVVCPGGSGGGDGDVGIDKLPCTPTKFFRAHAFGNLNAKYPVANPTNNQYVTFWFPSPFAAGEQATAWAPITDDGRVIHHWILYGTTTAGTDGQTGLGGTFVSGWAPGGTNGVLDPDVGLELNYPYFYLQIHYNNSLYNDAADASGVAFCTTPTPRTNTAGVVTLGNSRFTIPAGSSNYPVTGTCTTLSKDGSPITIIAGSPHMHKLGSGFRTEHTRGGASQGDIDNIALGTWSFDNQKHYPLVPRREYRSGDTLKTTCYYTNPTGAAVSFGLRTEDEMCFDFMTAYPFANVNKNCTR